MNYKHGKAKKINDQLARQPLTITNRFDYYAITIGEKSCKNTLRYQV